MTVGEILALAISLFAAMIGYFTWRDKRKDKKIEKERDEERIYRENLFDDFSKKLTTSIESQISRKLQPYVTIEKSDYEHSEISKEVKNIDGKVSKLNRDLEGHFHESIESEISRLATDIINYAEDLRNGLEKGENSFKHIMKCYDRYKKLGGNSFVDSSFEYIRKQLSYLLDEDN